MARLAGLSPDPGPGTFRPGAGSHGEALPACETIRKIRRNRAPVVLYEHPFTEGMRTMLRLERLVDRLGSLIARDAAVDHHGALTTLFEIVEVASRADLKADLMKELERHRAQLAPLRDNPRVDAATLDATLLRFDAAFDALNKHTGKANQWLGQADWIGALRSRLAIPGGTFEFDLPAYHAWQQLTPERRRADLMQWVEPLQPLVDALRVLLGMARQAGTPQRVVTQGGLYQQNLASPRPAQLLRLWMEPGTEPCYPEISAHRLLVSVRLMKLDDEGKSRPAKVDTTLEIAVCH